MAYWISMRMQSKSMSFFTTSTQSRPSTVSTTVCPSRDKRFESMLLLIWSSWLSHQRKRVTDSVRNPANKRHQKTVLGKLSRRGKKQYTKRHLPRQLKPLASQVTPKKMKKRERTTALPLSCEIAVVTEPVTKSRDPLKETWNQVVNDPERPSDP